MNYPILLTFIPYIFIILFYSILLKIRKNKRMELSAAKVIGAGIALLPLLGSALGCSKLFSTYIKYEYDTQMIHLVSGILLTQLPGLLGFIVSLTILFAF